MMFRAAAPILVCGIGLFGCAISDDDVRKIDLDQAAALQHQRETDPLAVLFIDPRPRNTFESSHIPGAINMSLAAFDGAKGIDPRISEFHSIVVYGQNPGDVAGPVVSKRLMQIGYSDVREFAGGVDEWRRAALSLESGPTGVLPPAPPSSIRRGNSR
ncbi:MAG: rhodanese-like domain-containing protein [Phycisphaerales bacterium]